uniref:Peroxidase-like n=1 Tax=Diabrotica virgifera virgifera TaxID=50390 RepID=A0A6P7FDY3_DIAVI
MEKRLWLLLVNVLFVATAQDGFFKNSIYEDLFGFVKYPVLAGNGIGISSSFSKISNGKAPPREEIIQPGCGTAPDHCPNTIYRSYDGSCNNLKNPTWGIPNTPYNRLLPAKYADGIQEPLLSKSGRQLPLARSVSLLLYPDVPIEDPIFTLNAMQYGQIITHDLSMTAGSTQTQHYKTRCCSEDGQLLELANVPEHCFPMILPDNDPAHSNDNVKCMSFDRTITDRDRRCVKGNSPAEQLTSVNHFIDLSLVYGNDDETNHQLREFKGGRLRFDARNGHQWPPRATNASGTCRLSKPKDACYFAGDTRINQNPQLALLHVILLREHNRIADILSGLNPHWDDEKLFQEARKICVAEHQYITYYEWLPYFVGVDRALESRLIWKADGFVDDYDEHVNPTVLNEHSTAALRNFHTLIAGKIDLVTENGYHQQSLRFTDVLRRPQVIETKNLFDDLIRGLTTQPQSASDQFHDSEVTQFMFREDNEKFGVDLRAIDVQRNRDHGLASYNDYRELWKRPRAQKFEDLLDSMTLENVMALSQLYEHPDDIDLIVAGSIEKNVKGALVGPTFLGIIIEQFYRTRVGDRFFFENSGPLGFKLDQLQEIRKASVSKLLCDNGHHVLNIQPRGFEKISQGNPLVSCESLPTLDLSKWKEHPNIQLFGDLPLKQGTYVFA